MLCFKNSFSCHCCLLVLSFFHFIYFTRRQKDASFLLECFMEEKPHTIDPLKWPNFLFQGPIDVDFAISKSMKSQWLMRMASGVRLTFSPSAE